MFEDTKTRLKRAEFRNWVNGNLSGIFYLSSFLICLFVPTFHWVFIYLIPDAHDFLWARLLFSAPAALFALLVWIFPKLKIVLVELHTLQIGFMMSGLVIVSGLAGFTPLYLSASLLGIVGAALTLQTVSQIIGSFLLVGVSLFIFLQTHPTGGGQPATYFYVSAFIISSTLALFSVFNHQKEFALRKSLKMALDDLQQEKAKGFVQAGEVFLGELSAAMAHQINTPLATLQGILELLKRTYSQGSLDYQNTYYFRARDQVVRIKSIIENILYFSGTHFETSDKINFVELLNLAIEILKPYAAKNHVELRITQPLKYLKINTSARDFAQSIYHLLKNGIDEASQNKDQCWLQVACPINPSSALFELSVAHVNKAKLPAELNSFELKTTHDLVKKNGGNFELLSKDLNRVVSISFQTVSSQTKMLPIRGYFDA